MRAVLGRPSLGVSRRYRKVIMRDADPATARRAREWLEQSVLIKGVRAAKALPCLQPRKHAFLKPLS